VTTLRSPLDARPGALLQGGLWGLYWGLFLALVLLGTPPALAQQKDSTDIKRFRRADTYLRAEKYDKAISLLESLYEEAPENPSFYRKLKEAYESVKRYDDALRLVEARLAEQKTPQLLSEKARLLYRNDERKAADRTWDRAVALAPEQAPTYRIVYQALVDLRRFRPAIEVLRQARNRLENDALFRTEMAYLYGLDGQHRAAMREYVALLKASPGQEALVRNRLQAFVEQGEGVEASIDVLTTAVEQNPLTPAFRELLAWLYMSTDHYARAYDVYRALDRLQQQKGQRLFAFAQKAADADHFEVATTALEAVLDRYPDAKVAPRAQRAQADTYRQWAESKQRTDAAPDSTPRYDAALAAYQTFLDRHPDHAAAPAVRSQLGTLQLDVYRDLDAAQSTLEQVVSSAPETTAAHEARYDLGRIALLRGDLERARLLFSRLAQRLRSGDLAEQARFELALLQFYRGRFDAARTQAKATSANPSADVTNDAIELRVLIQENTGPDSLNTPLRLYARARLALRRHDYTQAGAHLDSLLQTHGRHSLADEARFRRAEVFLAQGDTSAAVEQYRTLPRQHPRSPYADRSLFRLGTLYEQQNRAREAIQLYDRLLAEYPESLLASDVRSRLRTLRRTQS
jgi:tetratricopeptide (TPR) repeat protein